jgi:hypothetical protein
MQMRSLRRAVFLIILPAGNGAVGKNRKERNRASPGLRVNRRGRAKPPPKRFEWKRKQSHENSYP